MSEVLTLQQISTEQSDLDVQASTLSADYCCELSNPSFFLC